MLLGITNIRTVIRTCIKLLIVYISHSLPGSAVVFCSFSCYRTFYDIKFLISIVFYHQAPLPSLIAKSSQEGIWNHEESHFISGLEVSFSKKSSVLVPHDSLLSSGNQFAHLPR